MKGSNLKPLMIPRFSDQKLLKRSNTFGIWRSGGFGIELSVSITLCNALLVVAVQIVVAVVEGQMLSATRTVLYLCGGKERQGAPFKAERRRLVSPRLTTRLAEGGVEEPRRLWHS